MCVALFCHVYMSCSPSGAPPNPAGHAGGVVDLHGQRSTAKTRARVSGRGCRQQAATPGVASPAEAAQLQTGSLVV